MGKRDKNTITLGSGYVYAMVYTGTMPDEKTLCTEDNRLGYIKGGAALTYTATSETTRDDMCLVAKPIVTGEEASLKLGLITWNGETLQKLIDRCKVTVSGGKRIVKIGGTGNAQGNRYVICFVHKDAQDGDVTVKIVGTNTAGLTLTYATDDPTVIEPEFAAEPQDGDGTLIIIEETLPADAGA